MAIGHLIKVNKSSKTISALKGLTPKEHKEEYLLHTKNFLKSVPKTSITGLAHEVSVPQTSIIGSAYEVSVPQPHYRFNQ